MGFCCLSCGWPDSVVVEAVALHALHSLRFLGEHVFPRFVGLSCVDGLDCPSVEGRGLRAASAGGNVVDDAEGEEGDEPGGFEPSA